MIEFLVKMVEQGRTDNGVVGCAVIGKGGLTGGWRQGVKGSNVGWVKDLVDTDRRRGISGRMMKLWRERKDSKGDKMMLA